MPASPVALVRDGNASQLGLGGSQVIGEKGRPLGIRLASSEGYLSGRRKGEGCVG